MAIGGAANVGVGACPREQGYVYRLVELMETAGSRVDSHNLGSAAATFEDFITSQLPQALNEEPEIVTVFGGTNDLIRGRTPAEFGADVTRVLHDLFTETRAFVFVGDLPDLTQTPEFRDHPRAEVTRARIAAFNTQIRNAASVYNAKVVKISDVALADSLISVDGYHFNNKGYARVALAFWLSIGPYLGGATYPASLPTEPECVAEP